MFLAATGGLIFFPKSFSRLWNLRSLRCILPHGYRFLGVKLTCIKVKNKNHTSASPMRLHGVHTGE
jgi:hypothetical protein